MVIILSNYATTTILDRKINELARNETPDEKHFREKVYR